MKMTRIWLPAVGAVAILGCASSGRNVTGVSRADYVTAAELRASGQTTLEAGLRDLRPRWFNLGRETVGADNGLRTQSRATGRSLVVCRGNLFVYIDGERSDESLSVISVAGIVGVRFLRSAGMRPDGDRNCPDVPAVNVLTREEEPRAGTDS